MTSTTHLISNYTKQDFYSTEEKSKEDESKDLQCIQSSEFSFFCECLEKKIIDESGRLLETSLTNLPNLNKKQLITLKEFLDRKIIFSEKLISLIPTYKIQNVYNHIFLVSSYCHHYQLKMPFIIQEDKILINLEGNLFDLFKFLVFNNPQKITSIVHYGGSLPKILGINYYRFALKKFLEEKNIKSFENNYFNHEDFKANDYDFRIFIPNASKEMFIKIEKEINLYFIRNYLSAPNFHQIADSFIYVLNQVLYTKNALIQRNENKLRDYYLLKSFGIGNKEIDLSIISELSQKELFSSHGLYLELIPFLNNQDLLMAPSGTLSLGWQSVFDRFCKTITVTDPQHPYYEGWEKMILFLTKGYWLPDNTIHEAFIQRILCHDMDFVIKSLIKTSSKHNKNSNKISLIGIINAAIKLRDYYSSDIILKFWEICFDAFNFKEEGWPLSFLHILKFQIATFDEMLDLMNYLFKLISHTHGLQQLKYKNNLGKKYYTAAIVQNGYLHFQEDFVIEDFNKIKILYNKNTKVKLFINSFFSEILYKKNRLECSQNYIFDNDIFDINPIVSFWLISHFGDITYLPNIICMGIKLQNCKPKLLSKCIIRILKKFHLNLLQYKLPKDTVGLIHHYIASLLKSKEPKKHCYALQMFLFLIKEKLFLGKHTINFSKELHTIYLITFLKNIAVYKEEIELIDWLALKRSLKRLIIHSMTLEDYLHVIYIIDVFIKKTNINLNDFLNSHSTFFDLFFERSLKYPFFDDNWNLLLKIIKLMPENLVLQEVASKLLEEAPKEKLLNLWLNGEKKGSFNQLKSNYDIDFNYLLIQEHPLNDDDLSLISSHYSSFHITIKNILKKSLKKRMEGRLSKFECIEEELILLKKIEEKKLHIKYLIKSFWNHIEKKELTIASKELISLLNIDDNQFNIESLLTQFFYALNEDCNQIPKKNIDIIINHPNLTLNKSDRNQIYLKLMGLFSGNEDLYLEKILSELSIEDTSILNEILWLLIKKISDGIVKTTKSTLINVLKNKISIIFLILFNQKEDENLIKFYDTLNISLLTPFITSNDSSLFLKAVVRIDEQFFINNDNKSLILSNLKLIVNKKLIEDKDVCLLCESCEKLMPLLRGFQIQRMLLILEVLFNDYEQDIYLLSKMLFDQIIEYDEHDYFIASYQLTIKSSQKSSDMITKILIDKIDVNRMSFDLIFDILFIGWQLYAKEEFYLLTFNEVLKNFYLSNRNLDELLTFFSTLKISDVNIWISFLKNINNSKISINLNVLYELVIHNQLTGEEQDILLCWKLILKVIDQQPYPFFRLLIPKLNIFLKNQMFIQYMENEEENEFFINLEKVLKNKGFNFTDDTIIALTTIREKKLNIKSLSVEIEKIVINHATTTRLDKCYLLGGKYLVESEMQNLDLCIKFLLNGPSCDFEFDFCNNVIINILEKYFDQFSSNYEYCFKICSKFQNIEDISLLIILSKYLNSLLNMHVEHKKPQFILSILRSIILNFESLNALPILSHPKIQKLYTHQAISELWHILFKKLYIQVLKKEILPITAINITFENLKYIIDDDDKFIDILDAVIFAFIFQNEQEYLFSLKENFKKIDEIIFNEKLSQHISYEKKDVIWGKSLEKSMLKKVSLYKRKYFLILTEFIKKILENKKSKKFQNKIIKFLDYAFKELIQYYPYDFTKTLNLLENYFWYSLSCKSVYYYDCMQEHCIFLYEKILENKNFPVQNQNLKYLINLKMHSLDAPPNLNDIEKFISKLLERLQKNKNPYAILCSLYYLDTLTRNFDPSLKKKIIQAYEKLLDMIDFNPYIEINTKDLNGSNIYEEKKMSTKSMQRKKSLFKYFEKDLNFDKSFPIYGKVPFLKLLCAVIIDLLNYPLTKGKIADQVINSLVILLTRLNDQFCITNQADFAKYNIPSLLCYLMHKSLNKNLYSDDHTSYFISLLNMRSAIYKLRDFYINSFSNILDFFDELHFRTISIDPIRQVFLEITRINVIQDYIYFLLNQKRIDDFERSKKIFKKALELKLYENQAKIKKKCLDAMRACSKELADT